ncbi:CAF17-like 4Fe-4S cluster assembly/insertion protein YgfZ [Rhodobium gokarnense]|uniref:Folate-binding protein YgfZ n=1 Tax=Rhodobium gokarnense TaxID=364296 RepID=A0ABT3HHV7_9HYPH|nr:folate-binding protein [Rhodobium gokarnense]MCW2309990.1 folate-binding protein YgfZ [Rhodobium gokarnense]
MAFCELSNRAVVRISGEEAHHFLQGLVTNDMGVVDADGAGFGALLTPQGKILFDFLIARDGDGYLFDTPKATVADLVKRLTFYKLRAKVEVANLSDSHMVVAFWGVDGAPDVVGTVFSDPRHSGLGYRAIVERDGSAPNGDAADIDAYTAHRVAVGVPEAGVDFDYGEVFPHDVDMDFLSGLSFAKGCFVGQEVVSRMQHRGTARRRVVRARAEAALPAPGTAITAGEKAIGSLGSVAGNDGLALVRLDRAKSAMDAGTPLLAGTAELTLAIPDWAGFSWPGADAESA